MTPPLSGRTSKCIKHLGSRPKTDQDNHCREKLCYLVKDVGCFYEICPEKLYMVYLAKGESLDTFFDQVSDDDNSPFIFWSPRDSPSLVYESFNMDFGPFNLAVTHQFCSKIKIWLDTQTYRHPDKYIVIVLDDSNTERKLNTTLLVAIAAMVLLNMTDQEVLQRLNFFMMYNGKPGEACKQLVFREKKKFTDVSGNQSLMTLTLEDCIRAFYSALQLKFYDYYTFDHAEYLFYETVMSGDMNWVVPGKLLAFAGPCSKDDLSTKYPPRFYYHYFKDHNVTDIVRLNEPEYDSNEFRELGFQHHDLIFPDGYPPTSPIALRFIKIVDEAKGGVAIHCFAGIGRTGTLIAAYLMARYNFTTQMAVAWTRICRPGSVIGEQQDWLYTKFDQYSFDKGTNRQAAPPKSPKNRPKIKLTSKALVHAKSEASGGLMSTSTGQQEAKTTYAQAEKTYGQAKALLLTKKQRERFDRPNTRSSQAAAAAALKLSSNDGDSSTSSLKDVSSSQISDVVLDLGKTVPLLLHLSDLIPLKGSERPKYYRLKDNKYEWKVKFPEGSYVELRHNYEKEMESVKELKLDIEHVIREPYLDFKYEQVGVTTARSYPIVGDSKTNTRGSTKDTIALPKLKPVVLYTLLIFSLFRISN